MSAENDSLFFGENRSLFSDYYLAERLTDLPEWSADVSEPFQKALELYQANKAGLPKMNESQTEKEFIQPILSEVLGYQYDVQHTEKRSGRLNIPDYIFFEDEPSLKKAQAHRDEKGKYYAQALALGDAKYWGRSLDGKGVGEKDQLTNANPSFQIVNYLTVTGLDWGILTNGSQWRLYSMKSRSRIDSYFEVDLQGILEEEDEKQFKYFYHFFRAEAFREDPETGQHFLGSVFQGSIDYGTRLEGRLKELIFDDVFLTLAKGFTEFRANQARNEPETEESLKEIYQGTLRLLYRLLFLLHAESRSLLPIENRDYFQYSLMKLKKDIAERVEKGLTPSSQSFDVWNDLDSLFRIIDQGDPDLNVPRYNGGLFRGDHPKNQFLGDHKISDKYLVPALELLTREPDPKTGRKRFIDYKSLNVEQLGSIYEGLLEFHLRVADEPLAVVKKRGREVFEPENEIDNTSEVIPKGELYLQNDKGERKATGSYYTPHYIVEYIVEHTLGPVFETRAKTFEELMTRLEPKYGEYDDLNRKIEEGDHSERTHNKRKQLNLEIESLENRATETLLSIKICDPAMGSGHFLKEATDKLAEKIITLLAQYPTNPVTKLLSSVREEILQSLDEQDISIDAEEHLKDTNLIKRMVMKRSIYGVDLNPMAVELAKLSLWLDSFTVGAPLSFLDHHLKTGNSLIGTTVKEVKHTLELDEDRQIEAFGGPFSALLTATQLMRDVAQRTDATISEVQESVAKYHDYEEAVKPYKRLLDLWISRHFDNDKALVLLRQYPDKIIKEVKGEESDLHENYVPILKQAEAQAESKRFFHWELEFPEVFIDLKQSRWLENPGFDAVVGNPPYEVLMSTEADPNYVDYLNSAFDATEYRVNLYGLFLEKANEITSSNEYYSFIIPNTILANKYFEKLRKLLLSETNLRKIVFFEDMPFRDATVEPIIISTQKTEDNYEVVISRARKDKFENVRSLNPNDFSENERSELRIFWRPEWVALMKKLKRGAANLSNFFKLYNGIKSTNNSKYVSKEKKNKDWVKVIRGSDISAYHIMWDEEYVLFDKKVLKSGFDKKMHESTSKIVLRRADNRMIAAIDTNQLYVLDTLHILKSINDITVNEMLPLINSKLSNWWLKLMQMESGKVLPEVKLDFLSFFPVPNDLIKREQNDFAEKLSNLESKISELVEQKNNLLNALDPFKFLNKGVGFKKFSDVFSVAIKYGQQLTEEIDIGTVHHDIEELRLRPDGDRWLLSAQLKHRDPETGWGDWIKEDEHTIARTVHDIYRFKLSDEEARYWQQAFEVLGEFENSGNFPGGKTRTTHEKLMKSKVPVFDESANIQPLIELREELAEVEEKIEKTDWLIDQVVYQLYGLSEEEIEVVEGRV